MNDSSQFPNGENGNILRCANQNGDPLTDPRYIDFCFAFFERKQALAFAALVEEKQLLVEISYYDGRQMWQVQVKEFAIPSHRKITEREKDLSARAESVGGEADGWGFMTVKPRG